MKTITPVAASLEHGPGRRALWWAPAAVVCTLLVAGAAPVRAEDKIEDYLLARASKVVRYLKKQGYKNVGVLKFRVQKGDRKADFHVGPLNVAMATRLENVLLAENDKANPLGIIHDAGRVAASKKEKASYLTPEGCDKLFRYKYPLVWGDPPKLVAADAFVTGLVKINPVKRTTTITIEAVDRKNRKPVPVTSFDVRTDRSILTDVCTNFALGKRQIRTMAKDEADDEANKKGNQPDKNKGQPAERLVDLEILYDGATQEETPSEVKPDAKQVPEPQDGAKVVLRIKNRSDRRVAVLLAVNGKNTLYQDDIKQSQADGTGSKWVLDPGGQYEVLGYYQKDDKSYLPFKILSKEESEKEEELETNEYLGVIHMIVFEEGTAGGGPMAKTMGLRKALPLTRSRPRTARQAAALVDKLGGPVRSAGVIKPDPTAKETDLKTVEFKDPKWQETRVIWYYYPKKKPGGGN